MPGGNLTPNDMATFASTVATGVLSDMEAFADFMRTLRPPTSMHRTPRCTRTATTRHFCEEATILRSWPPVASLSGRNGGPIYELSIVRITASGSGHRGRDRNADACQNPRSLTRGKARREQTVVDLTRDGKAVKRGCGEKQPRIVREAVRGGIDVALGRRDDAVMIGVHACHFSGIGVEQPPLEIVHIGLKGGGSLVNVQIDFVGETARNATLTKFALRVHGPVKLVRIAGKSRI